MNSQRFCDWLNGYVELGGSLPSQAQWDMIKDHLALVFDKVTPPLNTANKDEITTLETRTGWHDKLIESVKTPQQVVREAADKAIADKIEELKKIAPLQIKQPSIINPDWPYQIDPSSIMPYPTQLVARC